jgi:predicted ATP-grasp superfamily ATP-dependent carboligase
MRYCERLQFVRWRGELAHVTARTIANYPFRVGPSTISEFFPSPPDLVEVGASLLETFGYDGPGVIQFIERHGVWHVHDVNPRMPSSVDASIAAGLDMPRLAVEIALGRRPNLGCHVPIDPPSAHE